MDLAPFAAFILATTIGLGLSLATFLVARSSGLLPVQGELISTLKDNADALERRLELLRSELDAERQQRLILAGKVARMEALIVELVDENNTLRAQVGLPKRVVT
jgi:hypothetical protein